MLGQLTVLNTIREQGDGESIISAVYGGSPLQIEEVWAEAMTRPTPRHAGEYVLENL